MTALPPDVLADLNQLVAELEQRLESSFAAHDAAIAAQAATAQENARLQNELAIAREREAAIAIENERLFNETREALERQTATSEILKVIASSPSDVQPVFEAIADSAKRLLGGFSAAVYSLIDDMQHLSAFTPINPAADAALQALFPRPLSTQLRAELTRDGEVVHVPDIEADPEVPEKSLEAWRMRGFRGFVRVPMRRDRTTIGMISVTRAEPGPFAVHHIELLQTFADQAVIAIENARLFNETREALERQTATADILRVIASSPADTQPVFEAIAGSAKRLLGGFSCAVWRFFEGQVHLAAYTPTTPAADEALRADFPQPVGNFEAFRFAQSGKPFPIPDTEAIGHAPLRDIARLHGFRSVTFVPLMNNGVPIGIIAPTRAQPGAFAPHHVQLLQTFADQAVIAIENARLFNEVQTRTRDLTEALAYQTGSSNVLRVIASSPTDVDPVLKAIVESARELCEANDAVALLKDGEYLRFSAHSGPIAVTLDKRLIGRGWTAGRAFVDQKPVHVHDMLSSEGAEFPDARAMGQSTGSTIRTVLSVPLLRGNESIGAILLRRTELRPFKDKQINLLTTFADQAVIAIQNARLFDQVQAKTTDLEEALTYQTGTANILRVIASSPTDVEPVLKAIVESACDLCGAYDAMVRLKNGENLEFKAHHGPIPISHESIPINRAGTAGLAVLDQKPVHVHDVLSAEGDRFPEAQERARQYGHRTVLTVPLLHEGQSIGVIIIRRTEVEPFSDKQIALLETFADQAVIAIGNVRLFEQVQQRTRDLTEALTYQTGTGNILRVIASSPTDVGPALDAIVESACELCEANDALVTLRDGDELVFQAQHGSIPIVWTRQPIDREGAAGLAVMDGVPVHVHDLRGPEGDQFPRAREFSRKTSVRTVLCVPLTREGESIGAIVLRRTEVRPFSDKQINLLKTFADQAVIAIGNARLFEQVQQRTRELAASLDELRTAQDRLIQTEKLASLGQLTAGIAHEIKNPLNFVNNFAALSAELTDELNDVLRPAALDDKTRDEVGELTGLLKDNLEKVVQHGKRADSIVKNMLLHSREGSGDHRPADINALIDESLNLAYHGARAEKPDFNVTIRRDFDPAAGSAEVFPQEITRVFLNLVSNGFYAVAKRKSEAGEPGYDPQLSAATRNLEDSVEIRIRDNGTGIPPDVKDKMFNPFFTTKPAGEGTGLGLSMSHDIIVKQHGGTIEVETEPGQFTEFRIMLPRTGNSTSKNRG